MPPRLSHAEKRSYCLRNCLFLEDVVFASGARANNKLDVEQLEHDPIGHAMADELADQVSELNPKFVVAVPRGAWWISKIISKKLALPQVMLAKDAQKTIMYANQLEHDKLLELEDGVVIEDLFNRYTNTRHVLALPDMRDRIIGAAALFDRGNVNEREALGVPAIALVHEPIPDIIDPGSVYWNYAKNRDATN